MENFIFHTKPYQYTADQVASGEPWLPPDCRQSRQTIAAVIEDGVMKFGKASCCPKDVFIKRKGRSLAINRAKGIPVLQKAVDPSWSKQKLGQFFVEQAKELITPAPEFQVKEVTIVKRK